MIRHIKARIRKYKSDKFLKKHNCSSWAQYGRMYDVDYNNRATNVKDYYHGYPYRHVFEKSDHYCYHLLWDHGPAGYRYGYHDIIDWCKVNLKGKHRTDYLRVNLITKNEWELNELCGADYIFVAFKEQKDYNWFKLRWE